MKGQEGRSPSPILWCVKYHAAQCSDRLHPGPPPRMHKCPGDVREKSPAGTLRSNFVHGRQQTCRLLARDPVPHAHSLARRLPAAPLGFFLAGDLVTIQHKGEHIEGVGRHYSSSRRAMFWGHTFTSSALVAPAQDPCLLRCDPFPDTRMATPSYPRLTPTEALLNVVGDLVVAGFALPGGKRRRPVFYSTGFAQPQDDARATGHALPYQRQGPGWR